MTRRSNGIETIFSRWSRRKLSSGRDGDADRPQEAAADNAEAQAGRDTLTSRDGFRDFDFDSLSFASDYSRFMSPDVPENVRSLALKRLWSSSDVISRPDDLDDYLEDFTEEAMALPAELAKSAYEIGRGFVADEAETSQATDDVACQPDPSSTPLSLNESVSTPVVQPHQSADCASVDSTDARETADDHSCMRKGQGNQS